MTFSTKVVLVAAVVTSIYIYPQTYIILVFVLNAVNCSYHIHGVSQPAAGDRQAVLMIRDNAALALTIFHSQSYACHYLSAQLEARGFFWPSSTHRNTHPTTSASLSATSVSLQAEKLLYRQQG